MMRQYIQSAVNISSSLMLLAIAAMVSWQFFSGDQHYYHNVISTAIHPNVVKSGEPIVTRVVIDRNVPDTCTIEIQRVISEADTGIVVFSQIAPGIAHLGSENIMARVIPIPALPPGKYNYSFRAINQCGGGIIVMGQSRLAPFTVI